MAGSGHLKTSSPVDLDGMPRWRFPPFQMSIGWPEGNGCRHRRMRIVPWSRWRSPWNQAITFSLPLPVPCTLDFREGHSIDPGLVFCAARPLSFFRCCTRSLDVRLVFFAEYTVPPNKPGGKGVCFFCFILRPLPWLNSPSFCPPRLPHHQSQLIPAQTLAATKRTHAAMYIFKTG
ncbi:hypothetical protein B0H13DRAFT_2294638 [Mycena leptocephala]|nr:hypothetical protein B0H13DRAFT_2294638 [Mycena leptocephala]